MFRAGLFDNKLSEKFEIAGMKVTNQPLSQADITNWLRELRNHSLIDQSHYAVASVVEAKVNDQYVYTAGVNVENPEHNRLGIHAEQNAIATLQTYLGGNAKFSKLYLMAAPDSIKAGSKDPLAGQHALCCGHCRQIIASVALPNSEIFSVSCNGSLSVAYDIKKLLPEAFSENDLSIAADNTATSRTQILQAQNFKIEEGNSESAISTLFANSLKPHIIDEKFVTSPVRAAIFKLANDHYVPGVLAQDVAFLTTDAIFTAFGHCITRFGSKGVRVSEIHLYGNQETIQDFSLLTSCELKLLSQFSDPTTPVFYYHAGKLHHQTTLTQIAFGKFQQDFSLRRSTQESDSVEEIVRQNSPC